MTVWQRKHNGAYSTAAEGLGRLTLPGNRGQISLSCFQILRIFELALLLLGMECMRCSSRPSRNGKIGAGRALARLVAGAFLLAIGVVSTAHAQVAPPPP